MNHRFLPDTNRQTKSGLEKHHKLVKQTENASAGVCTRDAMPGNWRYSEVLANEVWTELESAHSRATDQTISDGNPFQQIDAATDRIKNTIANFEVHDQDFIVELLNFMGDDSAAESLDGRSLMSEAREGLVSMIDEHVTMSEKQERLLVGMKDWFGKLQQSRIDGESIAGFGDEHIEELKVMLDQYARSRGGCVERVEGLHQDMVQKLRGNVSDARKTISQRDQQITELEQQKDAQNRRRTGGLRTARLTSDHPEYGDELMKAQRKVLELQTQVAGMKRSLRDISDVGGECIERDIGDVVTDVDLDGDAISVRREIEFATKLRVLQDQILNLKDDNDMMRTQMAKDRQLAMTLETKVQTLDRQKKAAETSSQASSKQLDMMKCGYEEQIAALERVSSIDEGESTTEMSKRYEEKLEKVAENYRKQLVDIQEEMDKRHKTQLREIMAATGNGEVMKAFDATVRKSDEEMECMREQNDAAVRAQKQAASRQLMELAKHYETLLKKKDSDIARIRDSADHEVRNKMLEQRIEFDEKANTRVLAATESAANELAKIRQQMSASIAELKQKLIDVTRERDTLKTIINENDIVADLVDEVVLDAFGDDEEVEQDDVLQQSLMALKEREVEQKMTEKHSLILKAQKEMLAESAAWELDQVKIFYKTQYDDMLNTMRRELAGKIEVIQSEAPELTQRLDTLLVNVIGIFGDEDETVTSDVTPMVPLQEVDTKLNSLKSKLLRLFSNRGIWKNTLRKLKSLDMASEDDIIEAMKQAISIQATKYDEMKAENMQLKEQLKIKAVGSVTGGISLSSSLMQMHEETIYEDGKGSELETGGPFVFEVKLEGVKCFNCHHSLDVKKRIPHLSEVDVSRCPKCRHLTLLEQSRPIEDVKIERVVLPAPVVIQTAQPADTLPETTVETQQQSSATFTICEGLGLVSIDESHATFDVHEDLLQSQGKQVEEIEATYTRRINAMAEKIRDLKNRLIDASMNAVQSARSLSDDPKNLPAKVQTSLEVTVDIERMNRDEATEETREAIHKLTAATKQLDACTSCQLADDVLDQTHDLLLMISHEPVAFGVGRQESTSARNRREDLNTAKRGVLSVKEEAMLIKDMLNEFLENHHGMLLNLGSAAKNLIATIRNVRSVAEKTVDELVQAAHLKTLELDEANARIQEQTGVVDNLHSSLRTSVVQLQRLNIEKGQRDDEVDAFVQSQVRSDKYIEQMVEEVNSANRKVLEYKKTADHMKIALTSGLSIDNEMPSARFEPVLRYVPPFRVFDTDEDELSSGFSLVPRNTAFVDAPSPTMSASSLKAITDAPLKIPTTPEKVRVRVGTAQKITKPGRMVLPKPSQKLKREASVLDGCTTPRSIPFENLVPISDEEMKGTLIGYVTHYVSSPVSKAVPEKPVDPRRSPLKQSPLLISEVPLDRLRMDSGRPDPPTPERASPKNDTICAYERRAKAMERQLYENVEELQREREKVTRLMEANLDMKTKYAKSFRAERKNGMLHEATKRRLGQALTIIGENDQQIVRLKRLVKELGSVAGSVAVREGMSSPATERKKQMARHFEEESECILNIFRGVSVGMNCMARHELDAVRRWIPRKEMIIKQQRDKMVATLKAMEYVCNTAEVKQPVTVSSVAKIKIKKSRPVSPREDPAEKPPTFEEAAKAACIGRQTLPRGLTDGVVGAVISGRSVTED